LEYNLAHSGIFQKLFYPLFSLLNRIEKRLEWQESLSLLFFVVYGVAVTNIFHFHIPKSFQPTRDVTPVRKVF
ncbi:MAG: hypothetical protein ABF968_02950, partial [Acetobacter sp.]|uniref:hypothetical protein n=1 Tax=Acetobacter sp. TaxID=440 RepID=UPI0039E98C4A